MMDIRLSRYVDGELDEQEAADFLEALQRDESLAAELRQVERLLAVAGTADDGPAPLAFVEAVMERIAREGAAGGGDLLGDATPQGETPQGETLHGEILQDVTLVAGSIAAPADSRVRSSAAELVARPRPRRWGVTEDGLRILATAAVLALVFLGGLQIGSNRVDPSATTSGVSGVPATGVPATATSLGLHTVRLVYVPSGGEAPERVQVAGDFNDWDAGRTPLRRVGDVWVATLALPPGEYEYMFVENGDRWVTDPLASRTRTDGFGGRNAVLDVGV